MTEKGPQPWWRNGIFVALIGAIIPAATFVQGWLQSKRELRLQEGQQMQQLRLAYLNVMVNGGVERLEMLADFVAETEQDPQIRVWAEQQREKARQTVKQLEAQISEEQKKAATADAERLAANERANKAEAEAKRLAERAGSAEKEQAQRAAEQARAAAAKADRHARATEAKVNRSRETLLGRPNVRPEEQNQMQQRTLPPEQRRHEAF